MNIVITTLYAPIAILAFLSSSNLSDRLHFASTTEIQVRKHVREELNLALVSEIRKIGGGEQPEPDSNTQIISVKEIDVTDRYGPMHEGQLRSLHRTYEKVGVRLQRTVDKEWGKSSFDINGRGKLEDLIVEFRYGNGRLIAQPNPEWNLSAGEVGFLERPREDMGFSNFIPNNAASVGYSWEIEANAFVGALAACGRLPFSYDLDSTRESADSVLLYGCLFLSDAGDGASGRVKCTLVDVQLQGSQRVGVIDVAFDVASKTDQLGLIAEMADSMAVPRSRIDSIKKFVVTHDVFGAARIAWNMVENRITDFNLGGSVKVNLLIESFDAAVRDPVEHILQFEGSMKVGMQVSAIELK